LSSWCSGSTRLNRRSSTRAARSSTHSYSIGRARRRFDSDRGLLPPLAEEEWLGRRYAPPRARARASPAGRRPARTARGVDAATPGCPTRTARSIDPRLNTYQHDNQLSDQDNAQHHHSTFSRLSRGNQPVVRPGQRAAPPTAAHFRASPEATDQLSDQDSTQHHHSTHTPLPSMRPSSPRPSPAPRTVAPGDRKP